MWHWVRTWGSHSSKEIEDSLLRRDVDIAVHSCKDLATTFPEGLCLGAVLEREDPRDVLVARDGLTLAELPAGARVGTASVRREVFLARSRPDLVTETLRGNVPTRVAAVQEGRFDGVILAAAGLERLDLAHHITDRIDPDLMLPAAAQGAIAVQLRCQDEDIREAVATIDHPASRAEVVAERGCLNELEAGCQAPVGVLARASEGHLSIRGRVLLDDREGEASAQGSLDDAEGLGRRLAADLLKQLGVDSLRALGLGPADPAATPIP